MSYREMSDSWLEIETVKSETEPLDAETMLAELLEWKHETVLIPASEQKHSGHCIRAVQTANPKWYREFVALYPRGRRNRKEKYTDSFINRRHTIRALERIIAGDYRGVYAERLLSFIESKSKIKGVPF